MSLVVEQATLAEAPEWQEQSSSNHESFVTDVDAQAADDARLTCPKDHALIRSSAVDAGLCDGCGGKVRAGEQVMDCRPCNWYLCSSCKPVRQCPQGHKLSINVSMAGKCDGCSKPVPKGLFVMDCRQCNWYLCSGCQTLTECPSGHALKAWASQHQGTCDRCERTVPVGSMVMDCRRCNWYLCEECHQQPRTGASGANLSDEIDSLGLPQCPKGHNLLPWRALSGNCDGCEDKILKGDLVMDCRECNFYLCKSCSPILQCKAGHSLEACMAVADGHCDGCGRAVAKAQNVKDCRLCNWYICARCYLSRQ